MPLLAGTDPAAVAAAAAALAAGDLVAFATETVYGLGARADDDAAVAAIYAAKGRPAGHPLIVHIGAMGAVSQFASGLPLSARRLMDAFWPGPLTLILPRRNGVAAAASGGQPSIALRMPAHPVARALLHAAACLGVAGVAAPSANRYGRVSPTTAAHVVQEFGTALSVLDGGACPVGIESAIVDCTAESRGGAPALLRPGQLSRLQIEAVLGHALAPADAVSPRAPGTLASHYAPAAPVSLLPGVALRHRLASGPSGSAQRVGVYSRVAPGPGVGWVVHRAMPDQADAAAHELFAVLRALDAPGVAAIWVEQPPTDAAWDGVRDRLERAAA